MTDPGPQRLSRLRWLTRRGMKELDVMLERFVLQQSTELSDGAWPSFEAFLQSEDDRLWDWLQGRETPANTDYRALVEAIRRA